MSQNGSSAGTLDTTSSTQNANSGIQFSDWQPFTGSGAPVAVADMPGGFAVVAPPAAAGLAAGGMAVGAAVALPSGKPGVVRSKRYGMRMMLSGLAMGVVLALLLFVVAPALLAGSKTTAASEDDALKDFRASGATVTTTAPASGNAAAAAAPGETTTTTAPPAADPNAAVTTTPPAATGTATPTPGQPATGGSVAAATTTAPPNGPLVPPGGVYSYAASGKETTSWSGSDSPRTISTATATVIPSGSCYTFKLVYSDKHNYVNNYCGGVGTLSQSASNETVTWKIFGIDTTTSIQARCSKPIPVVPGGSVQCTSTTFVAGNNVGSSAQSSTVTALGVETVLGVPCFHVRQEDKSATADGNSSSNYVSDLWISQRNGVITKMVHNYTSSITAGPLGRITNTETATFNLKSLTPQT